MNSLTEYWHGGFNQVEGWVDNELLQPLAEVQAFQTENNVTGSVLEIGVHHGKFLLALAAMTAPGEAVVAIDLFDLQNLNVDQSGSGNKAAFLNNFSRYITDERRLEVIEGDSLTFNLAKKCAIDRDFGPFRFISVDGGHTAEHTFHDIQFAADLATSGTVISIDDYYNMHWPGVHEGTCRYMAASPTHIKPFCFAANKLFLSDFAYAGNYFAHFEKQFRERLNFKVVSMWGSQVCVFS